MATFEKFIEQNSPAQPKEKKIGSYLIGIYSHIKKKRLGRGLLVKSNWPLTFPQDKKWQSKFLRRIGSSMWQM
jgi:hypothetical protein